MHNRIVLEVVLVVSGHHAPVARIDRLSRSFLLQVEELEKDPVRLNSNLGKYTNYMNLLDLCGVPEFFKINPLNRFPQF